MATRAKSLMLVDALAVASMASNCRWDRPRVGDSGGTFGRLTCSAGDAGMMPSMAQVR